MARMTPSRLKKWDPLVDLSCVSELPSPIQWGPRGATRLSEPAYSHLVTDSAKIDQQGTERDPGQIYKYQKKAGRR